MAVKAISVSQLNRYIGRILQTDPLLSSVCVKGEISGLKKHSSGHWYFDLKDESSKIRCFLHAARVARLRYEVDQGMEVTIYGVINVYEPGGYYSVNVTDIQLEGEGALAAAFEKLKAKLSAEGLFDPAHKRQLPPFPKKIGVVTSPTGAAVRDIITTIKRRYPLCDIIIYPALVQGENAAPTICNGIRTLNEKFPELDLMIVGRGGGSIEDLWPFNEESVARAVYDSKIPVISAVGHEVDTVITDYVADLRAATPTAAAELAVPHIESLKDRLSICSPQNSYLQLAAKLDNAQARLEMYKGQALTSLTAKMDSLSSRLKLLKLDMATADPRLVLEKGYAMVKAEDDSVLTKAEGLEKGQNINIVFADGSVKAVITANGGSNA